MSETGGMNKTVIEAYDKSAGDIGLHFDVSDGAISKTGITLRVRYEQTRLCRQEVFDLCAVVQAAVEVLKGVK